MNKILITPVFIQDPVDMGYTAYFAEFPEVIAEGKNVEEAKANLLEAFFILNGSLANIKHQPTKKQYQDY